MPHKQARQHCGTPCVQHRVRRCFKVKHMRSIQATGKSVDAAIFSGLQQLGLSIDEVTINVIQHGTKGLLGIGAKPAIVELTEKPAEEVVVPDFTAELARERRERTERRGNRDNRSGRDNRENRDNRRREDRETVTAIAEGVEETRKEIIEPEIPETDMPVGTGTAAAEAYDENAKYDVPETVNRAEDEFAAKPERNEKYERNNHANFVLISPPSILPYTARKLKLAAKRSVTAKSPISPQCQTSSQSLKKSNILLSNQPCVSDNNPIFISSYALLIYKASLFLPPSFLHREFPESAAYDRNGDLS